MTTREVVLDGGSPWGFRMHGGADVNQPLRISRVNPGSKAALRGIREGDLITSINGQLTKDITNTEAHGLLKNAGETLRLGLNEDYSGSPKRRQYRTVHQETHSETVKRSSVTTCTIKSSKTIESQTETNNEKISDRKNNAKLNGDSKSESIDNAVASQGSTLSSNCTSPSTPSTLIEEGADDCRTPLHENTLQPHSHNSNTDDIMADSVISNSKSRRRRSRNQRKKGAKNSFNNIQCESASDSSKCCDNSALEFQTITNIEHRDIEEIKVDYRVDSPETVVDKTTTKNVTKTKTTVTKSKSLDDDETLKIQELSEVSEGEDKTECHAIVSEAESEVEWDSTADLETTEKETGKLSTLSLPLQEHSTEQVTLISPEEELTLRNFLEGLNLVNSPEDAFKQTFEKSTADSIKIKKAQKRAALEQYFLPKVQNPKFLDVISEEASDISDKEQSFVSHHLKQGTPELDIPNFSPKPPTTNRKDRRRTSKLPPKMKIISSPPVSQPTAILVETKLVESPLIAEGFCSTSTAESVSGAEVVYLHDDSSESNSPNSSPSDYEECNGDEDYDNNANHNSTNNTEIKLNEFVQNEHVLTQLTPPPTPDSLSPKSESSGININLLAFIDSVSSKLEKGNIQEITLIKTDVQYINLPNDIKNKIEQFISSNAPANKPEIIHKITDELSNEKNEKEVLNKEVASLSERLRVPESISYSNVISPPAPSRSPTPSSGSSSKGTTLSTAKYNPMNSSIGDITSLSKEEELIKDKSYIQPFTLRQICLNCLISLPFGVEILQELADVSLSIESLTNKLPSTVLPKIAPNLPAYVYKERLKNNNNIVDSEFPVEQKMSLQEKWVGIPTEQDPNLLLCLSPTQKTELEKTKKSSDEAGKLLDLHEKFLTRRSYHETITKEVEEKVTKTTSNKSSSEVLINPFVPSNRLLAIIQEEPNGKSISSSTKNNNYNNFNETRSTTLPRTRTEHDLHIVSDDARLKARDLSEWLQLARHKSTSESNLTTVAELKREAPQVPTNNRAQPGNTSHSARRRTSLPQEFYERQLQYLQRKEEEIQRELEQLENEKKKLTAEMAPSREFKPDDYHISRKGDYATIRNEPKTNKPRPVSMPVVPTEFFRQQMYEEYMNEVAEREERRQHKVIKLSSSKSNLSQDNDSGKETFNDVQHICGIKDEFMDKVKQKQKLTKSDTKTDESDNEQTSLDKTDDDEEPVLVMDGDQFRDPKNLPKHLQEFVDITTKHATESIFESSDDGIWTPGQRQETTNRETQKDKREEDNETIPPIWTPKSATSSPTVERKEFRSVNFESPVLSRKNKSKSETCGTPESSSSEPPWKLPETSSEVGAALSSSLEKRLPTSHSSPASGFSDFSTPRLPRAQNPTITLLQKAREGQLPRGASYIEDQPQRRPQNERPATISPGEVLYQIKNEYTSESDTEKPRKMADLGPRKFEGIGPTTKDGMPIILRTEVRDSNQSKWYKRMYDTIHKQRPHNNEYVTVRYKQRRAQYPYSSGYLSEPEPGCYDSDFADSKYATLDRRRPPLRDRGNDYNSVSSTMPRNLPDKSASSSDIIKNAREIYKNQPGRIENYVPGHSSISEKEAKEWWDEVMDIFDGHLEQQKRVPQTRSFINQALKESGYESDSTLVFRRKDEQAAQQLSPQEQKEAYKVIQKGGDVPLHGLRKPAPERPKEPEPPVPPPKGQHGLRNLGPESPRKYVENEVTIHYKTPVRQEVKEYLSEDELAYRQAEAMKKVYQEERRRKYLQVSKSLQELQDMNSRRHTDNFIPSQKSPIPLNRYDDFDDLAPSVKPRPRSPEPRLVARALYNFLGQTSRELTFRKGDLIYVRRQVDKNWYEGELNAMVGLFPVNYVEIVPYDGIKTTPRKSHEGQARAKYNFVAQTHLELSLAKGELVIITRKVDDNWYEGKIGGRKGIFPCSYVEVLVDPNDPPPPSTKPVAAPAAHSLLLNGSAGGKESMGSHCYTPSLPNPQLTTSYHAKPVQLTGSGTYGSLSRGGKNPITQSLHIETQSEPIPYRALYKYKPQNDDELELMEGDTVYVLEKCDDGWYVGSSERTGAFGTFPGNYVEKI